MASKVATNRLRVMRGCSQSRGMGAAFSGWRERRNGPRAAIASPRGAGPCASCGRRHLATLEPGACARPAQQVTDADHASGAQHPNRGGYLSCDHNQRQPARCMPQLAIGLTQHHFFSHHTVDPTARTLNIGRYQASRARVPKTRAATSLLARVANKLWPAAKATVARAMRVKEASAGRMQGYRHAPCQAPGQVSAARKLSSRLRAEKLTSRARVRPRADGHDRLLWDAAIRSQALPRLASHSP